MHRIAKKDSILVALFFIAAWLWAFPAWADHHYNKCDNKLEKGEPPGPFFGLEFNLGTHFLIERYCGQKLPPLKFDMDRLLKRHGCGPGDEIFDQVMKELRRQRRFATLREYALEGRVDPTFTEADARKRYDKFIAQVGGCASLIGQTGNMNLMTDGPFR